MARPGRRTNVQIEIAGEKKLRRKLKRLRDVKELNKVTRSALSKAGTVVRKAIEQRAPEDSGQLSISIIKKAKTYKKVPFMFVGPEHIRAPHAHLVEFGTEDIRRPKDAYRPNAVLVESFDGGGVPEVLGTFVGPMPAQPFMRPAWDSVKARVKTKMQQDLLIAVNRLAKK